MMATKTRKRYTEEFKAQVVDLLRTGKPVAELAEELCVSTDLRALRRENAQLRMENDILKKAAMILGTKNPHNSAK
jgi:transposase